MTGNLIGGKYQVDSFIGSGGMAMVYKAHSIVDGSIVAIKILRDEYKDDAEFKRRFEREALAGTTLSHDNIVRLLDVGEYEGVNYIVFEYIEGYTLKDYIKNNGIMSPRAAVNISVQVLNALSHAHERGIIHRDVKPQNVMITPKGVAKLADFGIARDVAASTKTFSGSSVMGSVHYISPEQAKGVQSTEQSDLYSVGIMLYEMLTGRVPFDSDNSVSVAVKHLNEKIIPPIVINPKISPSMNDIILKATSKDPDMRYKTAEEMKNDLNKSLREPFGRFAKQPENHSKDEENVVTVGNKKINMGIFKIASILAGVLALFLIIFIIITVNYNSTHVYVPSIVGKTIKEAEAILGDDFVISIESNVASEQYPSGYVVTQDPDAGKRATAGSKISVSVSIDSANTIVPTLAGMTLLEANNALTRAGLMLGGVTYVEDSDSQPGLVIDQSPGAESEVSRNSSVTISISGTPSETAHMPNVTNKPLDSAVSTLGIFGFEKIIVRYSKDTDGKAGNVSVQNMSPGIEIDKATVVELTVCGEFNGAFTSDRAYNLSIESNDTPVLITVVTGKGYEIVMYEALLPSGTQVASFTAYMDVAGDFECVVYINGKEYKRETVSFKSDN